MITTIERCSMRQTPSCGRRNSGRGVAAGTLLPDLRLRHESGSLQRVTELVGNHDATGPANQAASTTELRGGITAAKIEFGVVAALALVVAGHVFGGVPTADFADG